MNRRGFLGGVVGMLLAPAAAKINWKTPVKIAAVAAEPIKVVPIEFTKTYKYIGPMSNYDFSSPEAQAVLKRMKEDIDKITKQMMYETNRWCVGDKSVPGWKPRRVEVDPPWLYTKFGKG